MKTCSKCGGKKSATRDYFHSDGHGGLRGECIACRTKHSTRSQEQDTGLSRNELRTNWRRRLRTTPLGYMTVMLQCSLRQRSKELGDPCDLTPGYLFRLWQKQNGCCYWTGLPLLLDGPGVPARHPQKLSFDRIESERGYVKGNVILACNFANRGRGELPVEAFKLFLEQFRTAQTPGWLQDSRGPKGLIEDLS